MRDCQGVIAVVVAFDQATNLLLVPNVIHIGVHQAHQACHVLIAGLGTVHDGCG